MTTNKRKGTVTVKGIKMSEAAYNAFVEYLNWCRAESFRKQDVCAFLESWETDPGFRIRWAGVVARRSRAPRHVGLLGGLKPTGGAK